LIFDLGLGNNLNRRQLTREDKKHLISQWLTFHRKNPMPGRPTDEMAELTKEFKEKGLPEMAEIHRHIANSFGLTNIKTQKDLAGHLGIGLRTVERESTKTRQMADSPVKMENTVIKIEGHETFAIHFGRAKDLDKNFTLKIKEWMDTMLEQHELMKSNKKLQINIHYSIAK
jgi:hypothetical protein